MGGDVTGSPRWTAETVGRAGTLVRVRFWRGDLLVDLDVVDLANAARRAMYVERMRRFAPEVGDLDAKLLHLAQAASTGDVREPAPLPPTVAAVLDEWANEIAQPVIETGCAWLDRALGGGLPVGLTAIASPPGIGKSALCLQMCLGALVISDELRALWCRGEMTTGLFGARAAAHWSSTRDDLPTATMRDALRRTRSARSAAESLTREIGCRLFVTPPPLNIDAIELAANSTNAGLMVVDYLQLVAGSIEADRRQEVEEVVRRLASLATSRNMAVICVSNISKATSKDSRIGALSRESNLLDFAADTFLTLWSEDCQQPGEPRDVLLKIAKCRTAPTGEVRLVFDGGTQRFDAKEPTAYEEFASFGMAP